MLRGLPVLILVAVAAAQLVLARSEALSPWLGGGFGMFSSLDHARRRHLHVFVLRPGLRREVVPPRELEREVSRLLAFPSQRRMQALARVLADTPVPDHGPPLAVQVQVWSTRFDPETLTPSSAILREIVLRPGPGD